ncbi:hypothetical protein FC78_GL002537 [Companilactobacillus bobalius DSM 19674]|uniref:S-layer protein C-terminal domain-containing protein n=1 Tax=Companilactobacillus bobalius DSM 19674 TaxID=1423788 RepID=A0A0R1KGD0_9LACO|nr:hypothetical protein FC78_GL002537 [Companilactobacillus bobalius DSM 19674]
MAVLVALMSFTFSILSLQSVKAESVTNGSYVEVDVNKAELYNSLGRKLGVYEPKNSDWYLGKTIEISGKDFYQVATDEYLSENDSYVYHNRPEVITLTKDSDVPVYNSKLVESTSVTLAPGTSWYSDRVIYASGGMPFVRVATDEYVGMWYVVQQKFVQRV